MSARTHVHREPQPAWSGGRRRSSHELSTRRAGGEQCAQGAAANDGASSAAAAACRALSVRACYAAQRKQRSRAALLQPSRYGALRPATPRVSSTLHPRPRGAPPLRRSQRPGAGRASARGERPRSARALRAAETRPASSKEGARTLQPSLSSPGGPLQLWEGSVSLSSRLPRQRPAETRPIRSRPGTLAVQQPTRRAEAASERPPACSAAAGPPKRCACQSPESSGSQHGRCSAPAALRLRGVDACGRTPRQSDNTKFYELLAADRSASQDDLKRAYKKAAIKNHPDKGGDPEKVRARIAWRRVAARALAWRGG